MDVDTVEIGHLEAHLRECDVKRLLKEIAVLRLVADDDKMRCRIIVRQDREARAIVLEREFARAQDQGDGGDDQVLVLQVAGVIEALSGAPMEFHDGKIQIYRLCKVEARSGEELVLDLLIVTPETRQAWEGRLNVEWEGGILSVVSPEGLIALKSFRSSGQDQDDIKYLRSITDED